MLTVTAQLYAQVDNLFTLPPGAFSPAPKIHSTVLRLRIAPRLAELKIEPGPFLKFVKLAFAQKRKMLVNNLKPGYTGDKVRAALKDASARTDARAEALSLEQLAAIFRSLA